MSCCGGSTVPRMTLLLWCGIICACVTRCSPLDQKRPDFSEAKQTQSENPAENKVATVHKQLATISDNFNVADLIAKLHDRLLTRNGSMSDHSNMTSTLGNLQSYMEDMREIRHQYEIQDLSDITSIHEDGSSRLGSRRQGSSYNADGSSDSNLDYESLLNKSLLTSSANLHLLGEVFFQYLPVRDGRQQNVDADTGRTYPNYCKGMKANVVKGIPNPRPPESSVLLS